MNDNGFIVIMGIFFAIVIWIGLREVMTWYWKINRIVALLEKIEENTRREGGEGAPGT